MQILEAEKNGWYLEITSCRCTVSTVFLSRREGFPFKNPAMPSPPFPHWCEKSTNAFPLLPSAHLAIGLPRRFTLSRKLGAPPLFRTGAKKSTNAFPLLPSAHLEISLPRRFTPSRKLGDLPPSALARKNQAPHLPFHPRRISQSVCPAVSLRHASSATAPSALT